MTTALRLQFPPRLSGMSWSTYVFVDDQGHQIVVRRGYSTESGHIAGITVPHLRIREDYERPQSQGGYLISEILGLHGYYYSDSGGDVDLL